MATHDVPGANQVNSDVLAAGCWGEHADGSLIYVKGTEAGQVVYEIYDLDQDPPIYYQDAMREEPFKDQFSYPPVGSSDLAWTWHDKTPFPWSRVMRTFDKPRPAHADVHDTLSAAARVAESLRLRGKKLRESDVAPSVEQARLRGRSIMQRLESAFEAFVEK